jgi:hypothetical protein
MIYIMGERITSLSEVFPAGTVYYYGFPVGQDSNFFNDCPPSVEELVAMRPAVCAGNDMKVAAFSNTVSHDVLRLLRDEFGVPLIRDDQIMRFPSAIDASKTGKTRNDMVKQALHTMMPDGALVMAQPYPDTELKGKYFIDPLVTAWANDKKNSMQFVPEQHRIPEFARVQNGAEFSALSPVSFPYPCVVKVSSSGAGDGVRICKSPADFQASQERFKQWSGTILVMKFIDITSEMDVKFAVHADTRKPFEFVGHSHEITGTNGEYEGSVIRKKQDDDARRIFDVLKDRILPALQQKGWHGVGGVDVLIDADGQFFFSDFNCRMTAAAAQTMQSNAGMFGDKSILTFNGTFNGSLNDFREKMLPYSRTGDENQILNVVSLAPDNENIRLHGGVLFDQKETKDENILRAQNLGIQANAFSTKK